MKYYAQFKVLNNQVWSKEENKLVEVIPYLIDRLGSDGVFILDGRNSLDTMIVDCHEQVDRLRNIYHAKGFDICKGERFSDSRVIYKSLHLN